MSEIQPEPVDWLWPGRFARGKLSLTVGDPGVGKSYAALDIGARISIGGVWPDGGRAPLGNVLIVSYEDGLADTIRPRLDALGADVKKILTISVIVKDGGKRQTLSLAEHLELLRQQIIEHEAVLLILDPILAFMGANTDTHKSSAVRQVLAPLCQLAEETDCTINAIMHLNKRSGETNSVYRITSSLDFAAVARSVFICAKFPEDSSRRAMAAIKANLSALPPSLEYTIADDGAGQGIFKWIGETELSADDLLSTPPENKSARDEAKEFLIDLLSDGDLPAEKVFAAARAKGIKEKTLRRAAKELGVEIFQVGTKGKAGTGGWVWHLPRIE
jgi:putative DNA primase/helicase